MGRDKRTQDKRCVEQPRPSSSYSTDVARLFSACILGIGPVFTLSPRAGRVHDLEWCATEAAPPTLRYSPAWDHLGHTSFPQQQEAYWGPVVSEKFENILYQHSVLMLLYSRVGRKQSKKQERWESLKDTWYLVLCHPLGTTYFFFNLFHNASFWIPTSIFIEWLTVFVMEFWYWKEYVWILWNIRSKSTHT